jgi:hypothetical protein
MNGKGKLTFANGNAHEVDFHDGELNGQGKSIFASGAVREGEYID